MGIKKSGRYNLLALLAFILVLAGCASLGTTGAQEQPTNTPIAPTPCITNACQIQPTQPASSTPLPTCNPNNIPTGGSTTEPIIVPKGWTTFTDTLLDYTIQYPSNWIIPSGPCPGGEFDLFNHIPVSSAGAPAFPPGGFHIDVLPMPNPSQLSAAAFSAVARPNMPGGPPCGAYALQPIKVGGRDAVLATCPGGSASEGEGDPNQGYTYFIPDGTTMLTITQRDLVNGKPSPVLAQMIGSITFTG